ncbi:MAG: hypothetical protein RLZZ344_1673 [Pseudomonadota bacterium]
MPTGGHRLLLFWLLWGSLRAQPWRWLLALFSVAFGIALGVGIHLVNRSALLEFGRAIDQVNGQASVQLVSPLGRSHGFDERLYDLVFDQRESLGLPGVSPVLEIPTEQILVLGIDLFRAARVSPALLPQVVQAASEARAGNPLFSDNAVFLTAVALRSLGVSVGETIALDFGGRSVRLQVAGEVPGLVGQPLAVMDLGLAQWRFGLVGQLTRMDLAVSPQQGTTSLARAVRDQDWPLVVVSAEDRSDRLSHLSRAYRVNLTVLALVALLTGGFLVVSAIGLSVLRQQASFALLGALGAARSLTAQWIFGQSLLVSTIGGVLGIGLGIVLAWLLLGIVGGDLGGGYFSDQTPPLAVSPLGLLVFLMVSVLLGVVAGLPGYLRIRTQGLSLQMRAGQAETLQPGSKSLFMALLLCLVGAIFSFLPPVWSLPLFGYGAIASLLFAGVLLVPWLVRLLFPPLVGHTMRRARASASSLLAAWRLAQAPAASSGITSGVVAAVSLTVAMAVMVSSFRDSVSQWLDRVLPADVYTSSRGQGYTPLFTEDHVNAVLALEGVARVERSRQMSLVWTPERPEVILIARSLDWDAPHRSVPLVGSPVRAPFSENAGGQASVPALTRVFVSEAMVDLYGLAAGSRATLPIRDPRTAEPTQVWVAGVFRDYGRQHGAVVMASEDYERLTGDFGKSALSVWVEPGHSVEGVLTQIRALGGVFGQASLISAESLRALSLQIFDRSFALTYALELAALIIAVFAVASGLTAQIIVRRKEFAVLAQMGQSLTQRMGLVAREALGLLVLAVAWGCLLGLVMSQILIHRVNPQSFHWTMETSLPVLMTLALAGAVVATGLSAALWSSARLLQQRLLTPALREDW